MRVEFRHQAVRDLAWAIGSPSLLSANGGDRVRDDWCRFAFYDRIPWLRELDRNPADLLAWMEKRKSRLLGYYFELLIEYWLRHWHRMHLYAARLPLKRDKTAIGEFDFLFRDRFLGCDYHWETAVKFFLRYGRADGGEEWLGPNPHDTWPLKYNRVFGHQLALSTRPEAQALLRRMGIGQLQPKAFFKGYLFRHISDKSASGGLLPQMSPDHLSGWWCRVGEAAALSRSSMAGRWLSLARLHWLSPAYSRESTPGMVWEACSAMLAAHFDGSQKPLLLAQLVQGRDGIWRECARGFVVSDSWPALAPRRNGTIPPHE